MITRQPQKLKSLFDEEPITLFTKNSWYDYMKRANRALEAISKHVQISNVRMENGKFIYNDGKRDITIELSKIPESDLGILRKLSRSPTSFSAKVRNQQND